MYQVLIQSIYSMIPEIYRIAGIFVRVKFALISPLATVGKYLTAKFFFSGVIIYSSDFHHVKILSTIDYI